MPYWTASWKSGSSLLFLIGCGRARLWTLPAFYSVILAASATAMAAIAKLAILVNMFVFLFNFCFCFCEGLTSPFDLKQEMAD